MCAWIFSTAFMSISGPITNKGEDEKVTLPLYEDKLSGMRHFFALLPIEMLHHDERINPRPIGANVRGIVEEFHKGGPQLHVALAWIDTAQAPKARGHVVDGQHK